MKLELLADKPSYIASDDAQSTTAFELKLASYLNKDQIPLILVASDISVAVTGTAENTPENNKLIAAAQLRYQEMTTYPETSQYHSE